MPYLKILLAALCALAPCAFAQEESAVTDRVETTREAAPEAGKKERVLDLFPKEGSIGEAGKWRLFGSFTVSHGNVANHDKNENALPEEGFVGEFAFGASLRLNDRISGHARLCIGCHDLEIESANVQWTPSESWRIRAGRFALPVGGGNEAHDQSLRRTVSKSLTRSMGNMLRQREFNMGVLPAPTADLGVSVGARHDLSADAVFEWDVFAVRGFQGNDNAAFSVPVGINFNTSRSIEEDNNGEPAFGAHWRVNTQNFGFGAMWTGGNYNESGNRRYDIAVLDAEIRMAGLSFKAEAAWANTAYSSAAGHEAHFQKYAAWLQVGYRLVEEVELVAGADLMGITGIALGPNGPGEVQPPGLATDESNQVERLTLGAVYTTEDDLRFKANVEYWEFSDYPDTFVFQFAINWSF